MIARLVVRKQALARTHFWMYHHSDVDNLETSRLKMGFLLLFLLRPARFGRIWEDNRMFRGLIQ